MTRPTEQRRRIKRRSEAQEKGVAKDFGGRTTPGSGSGWRITGDVRTDRFLFECKTTEARRSITLRLIDLKTVEMRALPSGRVPVLTFDIAGERYHVLTDADFHEIIGGLDDGGS